MFCNQCGTEMEGHARFCGKCGKEVELSKVQDRPGRDMAFHVQILGWLFIGTGVLTGLLGVLMFFAGQIIRRLNLMMPGEIPLEAVEIVSVLSVWIGLAVLAVAAGTIAAGVGVLTYQSWGKVVALVMAALMVFKIPFGTAIAVYAFWVLVSDQGRRHFDGRVAAQA